MANDEKDEFNDEDRLYDHYNIEVWKLRLLFS